MLSRNRYALKEGAGVCDRLATGDHAILIRKGGIRERKEGFELEHREFFLLPTGYHEKGEPPPARVELSLYATVEADYWVTAPERLRRLEGLHALEWADVERRFNYGKEKGVHVVVLRAWRLARPHVIDNLASYEGCRSWVELEAELDVHPGDPAIAGDASFGEKLETIRGILNYKKKTPGPSLDPGVSF